MLAIHDQFTRHMRKRLKVTGIALGLIRLLQDARRFDEARTTLFSLEDGLQGIADEYESDKPNQKPRRTNRLKSASKRFSFVA